MTVNYTRLHAILKQWLPIAAVATVLSGSIYLAVQQNFRTNANDPQIQIAEDDAALLAAGNSPLIVVPTTLVDITKSLAPYVVVYDDHYKPVASSAQLNGAAPSLPTGVFKEAAQSQDENRITWQPQTGVRSAIVVKYYTYAGKSGYVMAGRSLREVEIRESVLTQNVGAAWIVSLIFSVSIITLYVDLEEKRKTRSA